MASKRRNNIRDPSGAKKKSKRERKETDNPPDAADSAAFQTITFHRGSWSGCTLETYPHQRILTLTPSDTRTPAIPKFSGLSIESFDFDSGLDDKFKLEDPDVSCNLFVANKCFGADYEGIAHLLEHILTLGLIDLLGYASAQTLTNVIRYNFQLSAETVEKIPEIVETFTKVSKLDDLVELHMRDQTDSVHCEFLEKLFPLDSEGLLWHLLGNTDVANAGSHKTFYGPCDGQLGYEKTKQKIKNLFKTLYIPANMYLLIEGQNKNSVQKIQHSFVEQLSPVKTSGRGKPIPDIKYSLSGKWIASSSAFNKCYRELILTWNIRTTDLVAYEFLATVCQAAFVKGGLCEVLRKKCSSTVYKVEKAIIVSTSAAIRHFAIRIWLHKGANDDKMVEVTKVVLEYLTGLKNWIVDNPLQYEIQFGNFRDLISVKQKFPPVKGQKIRGILQGLAQNYIYNLHNNDPTIDNLAAWTFEMPDKGCEESMERVVKILEEEFLNTSNMTIIDIKLDKEFQQISFEDLYFDQQPTEKPENIRLLLARMKLKHEKDVVKIDFDASFITKYLKTLPSVRQFVAQPPNCFFNFKCDPFKDACVVIEFKLEWCATSMHLDSAMSAMLQTYVELEYITGNHYSTWLNVNGVAQGVLHIVIGGLNEPAFRLLLQLLERLRKIRHDPFPKDLTLESIFLDAYQTLVHKMIDYSTFIQNLYDGMVLANLEQHLFQDQLLGLVWLAKQKDKFYSHFKKILDSKLHFASLKLSGNVTKEDTDKLQEPLAKSVGNECTCSVLDPFEWDEPYLSYVKFPGNKTTGVMRKFNCLLKSPLECFKRAYLVNSTILDQGGDQHPYFRTLATGFRELCIEERVGYAGRNLIKYSDDDGVMTFTVQYSTDVKNTSEQFHTMESIRKMVEDYLTPAGFRRIAARYPKYINVTAETMDSIVDDLLSVLQCMLTVELYQDDGSSSTSSFATADSSAYLIDWLATIDNSTDVLREYRSVQIP